MDNDTIFRLRELQRLVEIRNGWVSYLMSLLDNTYIKQWLRFIELNRCSRHD